ncbi:MAG: DEAD/DEAH box helicase [Flavobacteriales bacterium]|nr:DEAD/DEAH box helicase [Flavobacteriales bacterium]
MSGFEQLKLTRQFLNAVEEVGYLQPTEIQMRAIPPIMAGQDVIGIAQTGTGKTAAYLLPLLQMMKFHQHDPRVLVLAPSKELVLQINEVFSELAKFTDLKSVGLYGGIGPKAQIELVQEGVDLIIATPGRFMELYKRGIISIKKVKHLVLDECDRMMDMGFMPQLRQVQEVIPQKKQNLLFSATFPDKVERLSNEFLLWPTRIEITPPATTAKTVEQFVYQAPNFNVKANLLIHLLQDEKMNRVMVFVRTKDDATRLFNVLEKNVTGKKRLMHSNKGQNARINAVTDFKEGDIRILVSTDVTSRGMDITDVSHVINFNVPHKHDDYVHRVGRTGRAEKDGMAITFCDISEEYHISKIEKLIRKPINRLELPTEIVDTKTAFEERQLQMMEIDRQKKLEDPEFKGAFHKKKREVPKKKSKKK